VNPKTVKGSGLVPAYFSADFRKSVSQTKDIELGASYLSESGKTDTGTKYSLPVLRGWVLYEFPGMGGRAGVGPYATTSQKFSWSTTTQTVGVEQKMLLGAMLSIRKEFETARTTEWRLQSGITAAGGFGVDFSGDLRIYFGHFYLEPEGQARMSSLETSFGGVFKLGYQF
jgi:hypothetical protein